MVTIADLDGLRPDAERLQRSLDEISAFTESDHAGWTRRVLSEPYLESRRWVRREMADAGLNVSTDAAGNTIGVLPGVGSHPGSIGTGSHTDTVASGGRYDGIVGVVGAIEVARRLCETGTRLSHDLVVFDFLGEEPNEFGVSCVGSRSLTGAVNPAFFDSANDEGETLGRALERAGLSPDAMLRLGTMPALAGFIELHIEQGPVLERAGTQLGVVTAIAGIERVLASFIGRADHAGTAAMSDRRDALVAAAQAVLAVEQIGCSGEHSVATVGALHVEPGALNVVPSLARLWAELRSPSVEWLGTARREVAERFAAIAGERGIEVELHALNDQDPVPTAPAVQDLLADTASSLGYSWRSMPSGAGHDAAHIAAVAPTGMIFVPSLDGRSHCPEEFTDIDDIATGVHALAAALVKLDAR